MSFLGLSSAFAQCPAPGTPPLNLGVSEVCINSIPGTYDLLQLGTGAPIGEIGWFSDPTLTLPVVTTSPGPGTYYAAWVDPIGNPCFGPPAEYSSLEVKLKDPPPTVPFIACQDPVTLVFDLGQIAGVDKWYDGFLPGANVVGPLVGPGVYYGSVDANNSSNGCESELAILVVNPAPPPPIVITPGPFCEDPVTGNFNIDAVVTIPQVDQWYSDPFLTNPVAGPVPAGTYYGIDKDGICASQPAVIIVNPRPPAPVLSITEDCIVPSGGTYDLNTIASLNPPLPPGSLTWYEDSLLTTLVAAPAAVGPGKYWATYVDGAGCESAASPFDLYDTPPTLTGFNCGVPRVAGNNPGCAGEPNDRIRVLFCDVPGQRPTAAEVENVVKMNVEYQTGATLTFYDAFGGGGVVIPNLQAALDAAFPANTTPPTIAVAWAVTQTLNGCESERTRLRIRMRPMPDITVTTPPAICPGGTINLYSLVTDDNDVADEWRIYGTDPALGGAVLSTSPANGAGEPDGSVTFEPPFPVAGTFTFWYVASNEFAIDPDCSDTASVVITVNPEPVLDPNLDKTVCSGQPIGLILSSVGMPAAVQFLIINVDVDGGLIVVNQFTDGTPPGNIVNAGDLAGDEYDNMTGVPLTVTYTVIPQSAAPCAGDPVDVVITINPEPVMTAGLADTVCSYIASNLDLTETTGLVGVTYYWNSEPVLDAGNPNDWGKYPDPAGVYARPGPPGSSDPIQDAYFNTTLTRLNSTYTVTPVSAAGCEGDPETVIIAVDPAPVVDTGLDTICSGGTTNLAISAIQAAIPPNGPHIAADSFRWDAPTLSDPGLTGGTASNGDGSYIGVPAGPPRQIFIQDVFVNTTNTVQTATYSVIAKGADVTGGCESLPGDVIVYVLPEPQFSSNFPTLLCSDDPTVDLNAVEPTISNGVVCSGQWYRGTDNTGTPVSGVMTVSNGDNFYFECTVTFGTFSCPYGIVETVNLQEAPVLSAVANPVECADDGGVIGVSNLFAFINLAALTPTATQSGNPAVGSGAWHAGPDASGPAIAFNFGNGFGTVIQAFNGDQFTYQYNAANGCSASVTIVVTVNPLPTAILTGGGTICPPTNTAPAVQVHLTGVGPWELTWTDGTNTTTQSGLSSIIINPWTIPGSGTTPGTYQVLDITDANGCSTPILYPGSNTVQVAPDGPPAAICDDITVQLDGNGFATITGGDVGSKSTDGCTGNGGGNLAISVDPFLFTCASKGVNQVTVTVTDTDGNTATCVSNVTVEDNIRPSIVCALNATKDTDPGVCTWTVPDDQLDPLMFDDNCGVARVFHTTTHTPVAPNPVTPVVAPYDSTLKGAVFYKGTTLVVWTAEDSSGNQRTCAMMVVVEDNELPVITHCPVDRDIFHSAKGLGDCKSEIPNLVPELTYTDNCPAVVVTQDPLAGADAVANHNDQINVTMTITDCGGNTATCTVVLTVKDDEKPIISCPGDITIECDESSDPANTGMATATDNHEHSTCTNEPPVVTYTDVVVDNICPGSKTHTITRTWLATDVAGNTDDCVQTIVVDDTQAPVVDCSGLPDLTICVIGDLPPYPTLADFTAAGGSATDNCDLDIATFFMVAQTELNTGMVCPQYVERTYGVKDSCGNLGTCKTVIEVNDTEDPVWTWLPSDTTVNCEEDHSSANLGVATASDNCSHVGFYITESDATIPGSCPQEWTINRTWTATDTCGNSISHTQVINVQDTTAPALTVPADVNQGNDTDLCGAQVTLVASATDNCGAVTITNSYNGGGADASDFYPVGTTTVTFWAEDECGNISTDDVDVTINDVQDPNAVCQDLTIYLDGNGDASITPAQVDNGSTDNCGIVSYVLDQEDFDCSHVGNNTVTLTVTDAAGNDDACQATITVVDNIPPTPICQNITVQLDGLGNASLTAADIAGGSTDNCGIASMVASKTSFDCNELTVPGVFAPIAVTVTLTDVNNNVSNCTRYVTVADTIPPSITCISPAWVPNTVDRCDAPVTPAVPSTGDNCFVKTLTNDYTNLPNANAVYPVGITTVTWTVYDRAGNSTQCAIDVEVRDVQDPVAVCKDITVQLDATGNASITAADLDNGTSDNCSFVLTLDDYDFDCSDIQGPNNTNNVVAVTLTATDPANNSDDATCNVTVEDNVAPDAQCQNITVQLDYNGNASIAPSDVDNGSSDACGIASMTVGPNAFDCSNVGPNQVTLTVFDVNGNINSCNATVTVEDNVAPDAICVEKVLVNLLGTGTGNLTAAQVDSASWDACGIASRVISQTSYDCSEIGNNTVTLTVTDVNGNASTCTATVVVKDEYSPTASCTDITVALDAVTGDASIAVSDIDNGSSDNCNLVSLTLDVTTFDCDDIGNNVVTLTAVDAYGNDATCLAIVSIEDIDAPFNVTVQDISVALSSTNPGTVTILPTDIILTAQDNCTNPPIGNFRDPNAPPVVVAGPSQGNCGPTVPSITYGCGDLGPHTVTLVVEDASGNCITATATVTVYDIDAPIFDPLADVTVCNDFRLCEANIASILATASDNCVVASITNDSPHANAGGADAGGVYPVGAYVVTFTAKDAAGNYNADAFNNGTTANPDNTTTMSINVTVNDCEAPQIFGCPQTQNLPNVAGDCYQTTSWTEPTTTDNCGVVSFVRDVSDPSVNIIVIGNTALATFPVGTTTISYTSTDAAGNSTVCTFDIVVEDTEDPTFFNCPAGPITVGTDAGACTAQIVLPNITAQDNCPLVTLTDDVPAGSVFTLGTTTVTYTAQDNWGNTATCVFDVTVNDTEAPAITCPANITVDNDPGECGATVSYATPEATDNCNGFVGPFAPANWTFSNPVGGTVDASSAPDFITMTSPNNGVAGQATYTTTIPANGTLTFSYLYTTDDFIVDFFTGVIDVFDDFGVSINGTFFQVNTGVFAGEFGNVSVTNLNAGDQFGFVMTSDDGLFGPATTVISNLALNFDVSQIAGLGSGAQFPVGTTTETWVATDGAGNADTCSFTVTVNDTEDPTIVPGNAITATFGPGTNGPIPVGAPGTTSGSAIFLLPVASTNPIEDINVSLAGDHTWVGDLDFFLTSPAGTSVHLIEHNIGARDGEDFDLTLDDEAAPGAIQGGDFISGTVLGLGQTWQPDGIGENLNGNPTATTLSAFDGENPAGVWRLTVVDNGGGDSGNMGAWSLEISSLDPNAVAAVAATIPNDPGNCSAVYTYAPPVADDNCPGVVLTRTGGLGSGATFPVGTTTEEWTATDAAGNTTVYSFDITVEDTEAPVISCPAGGTVGNDPGDCDATLVYTVTSTDNCGATVALVSGNPSGASIPVGGSSTQVWMATDAAGNTASCTFTYNVVDSEDPVINGCPGNITQNNDPGLCGATVSWTVGNIVTSDNCPGERLLASHQPGSFFPVGTTTVTYTAIDAAGNTASCSFDVTVLDVEAPTITCPANASVTQDLSLWGSNGQCGANVSGLVATAWDNCSYVITNDYNNGGADASDFYPIGTTTVTFTATDPAGNTDACSITVTVTAVAPTASINNTNPMNICSTDPNVSLSANTPDPCFTAAWSSSPATVAFSNVNDPNATATFPGAGTYTLTWTVTSTCTGVQATANLTVVVWDPPVLAVSGTDPTTVLGQDGTATVNILTGSGNYSILWTDAFGRVSQTTATATGLPAGIYTVTVTDLTSGCVSTDQVELRDPTAVRTCELNDNDPLGFGAFFRIAAGSVPSGSDYVWVGHGNLYEYANGEVHIFGIIQEKATPSKRWDVSLWLNMKTFWGPWSAAGNTWVGNPATVGTNYLGWTFYTVNATKSTMTGLGFFAGEKLALTHYSTAGNTGFQIGTAANNYDGDYGVSGEFWYTSSAGAGNYSGRVEISGDLRNCVSTMRIRPVAMLEGAFNSTDNLMRDDLRANSLVPTTEPYTADGYTFVGNGGGETVTSGVLAVTGNNAVTDWVIVELRDGASPNTIVSSRAALIQRDGDIVDTDGTSAVEFEGMPDGDYFVTVVHRNHLGVMTANSINMTSTSGVINVDFTNPATQTYGLNAQTLNNGQTMMYGGDADFNGQIQNTDDVYQWTPRVGSSGYENSDYDLDGQVQNTDKVFIWNVNAGRGTNVPN